MHNGWKKICRSICRKMDVFVQRRWLCNLITSVALVVDSGIICLYSVLITWVNFVVLLAVGDGDLGRRRDILTLFLTRGLPLAGSLFLPQRAPGGVSLGQNAQAGWGCPVASAATPAERAPQRSSPCEESAQWYRSAGPAAGSLARSLGNLGLQYVATAERRRNKPKIKIDPPPLLAVACLQTWCSADPSSSVKVELVLLHPEDT